MQRCELCGYIGDDWQIHEHHIIPKEVGGSDHPTNKIRCCGTCHLRIYNPNAGKHSHHSKKAHDFIQLIKINHTKLGLQIKYITKLGTDLKKLDTWRGTLTDEFILKGLSNEKNNK